jgi:iron complex outermembrane receptor protein
VYDGDTTYAQPFCYYGTKKPTDAAPDRNTSIPLYEDYYPKCAVKEWVTFGLGYTYTGFKNWTMNLNIQNLLDEKAPYDPGYTAAGFNEAAQPVRPLLQRERTLHLQVIPEPG